MKVASVTQKFTVNEGFTGQKLFKNQRNVLHSLIETIQVCKKLFVLNSNISYHVIVCKKIICN